MREAVEVDADGYSPGSGPHHGTSCQRVLPPGIWWTTYRQAIAIGRLAMAARPLIDAERWLRQHPPHTTEMIGAHP